MTRLCLDSKYNQTIYSLSINVRKYPIISTNVIFIDWCNVVNNCNITIHYIIEIMAKNGYQAIIMAITIILMSLVIIKVAAIVRTITHKIGIILDITCTIMFNSVLISWYLAGIHYVLRNQIK